MRRYEGGEAVTCADLRIHVRRRHKRALSCAQYTRARSLVLQHTGAYAPEGVELRLVGTRMIEDSTHHGQNRSRVSERVTPCARWPPSPTGG